MPMSVLTKIDVQTLLVCVGVDVHNYKHVYKIVCVSMWCLLVHGFVRVCVHLCVCVCVCVVVCAYICTASDGNTVGSSLPSFIELLRINSCFNLYEYLKDPLCWGFPPSDFICLIKGRCIQ